MSFKSNGTRRNPKRILSSIVLLLIAIYFFLTLYTKGVSLWRLFFGGFTTYLAVALFRTSNE